MKAIKSFQIVDRGIEHSDYFQGCGVAFTEFTNVVTGIGMNPAEAIDDALESLAQAGWDVGGMELRICEQAAFDTDTDYIRGPRVTALQKNSTSR